jgi:predicted esterase
MNVVKVIMIMLGCNVASSHVVQGLKKNEQHQVMLKRFTSDGDPRISIEEQTVRKETMNKEVEQRRKQGQNGVDRSHTGGISTSFLKTEVVAFPAKLSEATKTLREEFIFISQVNKKAGVRSPLIVLLHGGGAHKLPTKKHLSNRVAVLVSQYKHPFNVLVPIYKSSPSVRNGWNPDDLTRLLKYVVKAYDIDPDKVFLTGHSMGGAGTFMWANSYPDLFAGIAPTSAGGAESPNSDLPVKAENLTKLPIWAFHGDKDNVCDYRKIEKLLEEVKSLGGDPKFTLLEGLGHNVTSTVYNDDKILKWFIEQL